MFTLQKLNVVRIVEDEIQKAKLVAEGFKEIVEEIQTETVAEKTETNSKKGKA